MGLNELSKYREQVLKYSLLDPFWCHIVDFGKEESVWKKIYAKSLLDRLKTKCFQLDINQIDDIITTVDQAYSDYNLSNEPPSIEIKSLLDFKQKSLAESILIRWQLNIRPEHPTQCSYERKKLYHRPPFNDWPKNLEEAVTLFEKPEDDNLDVNDSVQETVVIINSNDNDPIYISNNKDKLKSLDTTKEQGVTLFRVYSRKVDTAVTYSPETDIKLYLLICEAKHPYISQRGDYNKLCRMLNDAANSFILYWVKKCKMVTNELKKLFSEMRWIGLFSSDM
ncbi:9337_t:CDS:2 [Racocetra fulgida]|uniref:9337_t:CDS:1 n=1 Tax=Racocetra fulgida TaxID=60492 RepID=A0A9N8WAN1_9GLOM|nr:9337_t:CDS:2 [Racocetra fulgida]